MRNSRQYDFFFVLHKFISLSSPREGHRWWTRRSKERDFMIQVTSISRGFWCATFHHLFFYCSQANQNKILTFFSLFISSTPQITWVFNFSLTWVTDAAFLNWKKKFFFLQILLSLVCYKKNISICWVYFLLMKINELFSFFFCFTTKFHLDRFSFFCCKNWERKKKENHWMIKKKTFCVCVLNIKN